jgi:predicted ester cyclase
MLATRILRTKPMNRLSCVGRRIREPFFALIFMVIVMSSFKTVVAASQESAQVSRFTFAPAVQAVLQQDSPEGRLARAWVRYAQALAGEGGVQIKDVVTPDVRCVELLAAGYPPGAEGLILFRQQANEAFPDETAFVADMRFTGPNMVETELHARATHLGPWMGRAPTGNSLRWVIHTLNRFEGDRMAERWDRADMADLQRQIDGAAK